MSSRIAQVIACAVAASGLIAATGADQSGSAATGSLVAAYAFNDGAGTILQDSSGNGNNGTLANTSWASPGKYGGALSFNGTSSRVTVPNSASLQLSTGMTLEAWVNPTTVSSGWRDVIEKGNDDYYLMGTTDHSGVPASAVAVAGSSAHAFGVVTLPTNAWSYLAATYDGATLRLYVNGTFAASQAKTGAITSSTNALTIGSDPLYGQHFSGLIDNVRIYNSALTQTQIQTDMTTPVSPQGSDLTPPSAPGTLSATAISATRVDLSWGAASDNIAVTGYQIERCQGAGCSNFTQIATTTTSYSYSDTTTAAGTSYSYRVRANDAVPNLGPYTNTATATTPNPDLTPPTAPGTLSATAISSTRVDLSWGTATDNIAVTGYQIERCQGAGCSNFTQIATTATSYSYSDTTTAAGTSYSYRVRANDAVPNFGPYTNTATATTPVQAGPTPIAAYAFDEGSGTTVTDQSGNGNNGTLANTSWAAAGKYGKALSFNGTSSRVTVPNSASLQLSTGMTLEAWVNPTTVSSGWRDVIEKGNDDYYLMGTTDHSGYPGGGGTIGTAFGTTTLTPNTWTHLAVTYDKTTIRLYLNGTQVSTLAKTANLLTSTNALTIGSDPLYGQHFSGLIDNVRIYNSALTQTQIQTDMTTPVSPQGSDLTPPSAPGTLSATAISATRVDLSWGAASDNIAVTGYQIERCQGAGCSNFTQIATTTTSYSYSDTTTAAGTSYSYRVRANDAVPNLGPYTNTATATTPNPDLTPPTAPGTLSATAISSTRVDLSWGTATDNIAVTGYQIERCQGAGCSNFTQIATTTTSYSYSDTTTAAGTSYSYRVRANDAVPNFGPYTNTATATTPVQAGPTPIAAYAFDEGSGTTVTDQSGNGNNGTLANTSWAAAGKYGKALSFNGTSSRVTVPNSASLQLSTGMTLEAWVNPTTVSSGWRDVIEKGNDDYYLMGTTDHSGYPGGGGTIGTAFGTTTLTPNTWTHLAVTYDKTTIRLYLNGTQVSTLAKTANLLTSTNALTIGSDPLYGQHFSGLIDNVRIYNSALTQTQIQTDMTTPVSPQGSDLTPPSAPGTLSATAISATRVDLSWGAASDNIAVTGYRVFRNGTQVGAPSTTTYSDSPLTASTTYSYTVEAVDAAGNVSLPSATLSITTGSAPAGPTYPLKASANGRYLVGANGVPFLMAGDSPQALIGNLTTAQATTYLTARQSEGFNTIWVNLLCADYTGCAHDGTTFDGVKPLTGKLGGGTPTGPSDYDLATPNETYFARADAMINLAAAYGQLVILDPIETGSFLTTLQANGATKAFNYGVYVGNRYRNFPNIVWMNGNDLGGNSPPASSDANLVLQVMNGIASADPNHLQTVELNYDTSSSLDSATLAPRVNLNAAYDYLPMYVETLHAYNQTPTTPVFFVEGNYEGENNTGQDPSTPLLLRMQDYWSVLAGANAGQLYGEHYTSFFRTGWQSNLNTTGAIQFGYANTLFNSVAWYNLVPDQTHTVVTAGYGTSSTQLPVHTNDYATAARTPDGSLVMVYMPTRRTITVEMTKLTANVRARWFDPTNGTYTTVTGSPFPNTGTRTFTPAGNNAGGDPDWVLVLQGA